MTTSSAIIVIDANLAVQAVAPVRSTAGLDLLLRWRAEKARVVAPDLWLSEAVTAVRTLVFRRALAQERALTLLDDLLALGVELYPLSLTVCRSALEWAGRLGQARAYDSIYLALAEHLHAEFWTADRRLANRARQCGATWVHLVGEA